LAQIGDTDWAVRRSTEDGRELLLDPLLNKLCVKGHHTIYSEFGEPGSYRFHLADEGKLQVESFSIVPPEGVRKDIKEAKKPLIVAVLDEEVEPPARNVLVLFQEFLHFSDFLKVGFLPAHLLREQGLLL